MIVVPIPQHPQDRLEEEKTAERLADRVASWFGSMNCLYVLMVWQLGWMAAATLGLPLFKQDPYPFAFCLFLSNLIQLWALPVLGTTTNRADKRRRAKEDADHEALTALTALLAEVALAVGINHQRD